LRCRCYGCSSLDLRTHGSDEIVGLLLWVGVGIRITHGLPERLLSHFCRPDITGLLAAHTANMVHLSTIFFIAAFSLTCANHSQEQIKLGSLSVHQKLWFLIRIQSNLGSQTPRIMNNSVYEQIFRTQSVSDDVLSYEYARRQHRGAICWAYQRRQYS
jgi:hypothetical protein